MRHKGKGRRIHKWQPEQPVKGRHVLRPYQILPGDILTGHMGEALHRELYHLKRLKRKAA